MITNEGEKIEKEKSNGETTGFLDLFRNKTMRTITLITFYSWFVTNSTYYGLSLGVNDLSGNTYINFFISIAVEIPGFSLNLLLLNKQYIGRRLTTSGSFFIAGICLYVIPIIPTNQTSLIIAMSMLGKLAISVSFGVMYIFAAELFPTQLRNTGIGGSSMSGRLGGLLCPYVNLLIHEWKPLPNLIYGTLTISAAMFTLLLPETLNRNLPETLEDGKSMGKNDEPHVNGYAYQSINE